ncbi:MAG: hypothetical protein U5R31_03085 [Acidimicrobiia bacterium]|nr:hypothetical protein [Acidimicrobiia bacterium]
MLELLVGAVVGAVLIVGAWWVRPRLRRGTWLDRVVTARVIVHTTDGSSIEGLVRECAADGLVLGAARLLDHDVDVSGDLWVPRPKVAMVQRPGGVTDAGA